MKVPSFTFAGGVLGPGLYGHVDLNKYKTGVKRAENFLVHVEGGLFKRPGLYFVDKPRALPAKYIPWRIGDDDSYVLEFTANTIRFVRFGAYVQMPEDHEPHEDSDAYSADGYMEVSTNYSEDDIKEIKVTFANDIMYIATGTDEPTTLRRLGLYDWDYEDMSYNAHAAAPTGLAAVYFDESTSGDYDADPTPMEYKVAFVGADGLTSFASAAVSVDADLGFPHTRVELECDAVTGAVQYIWYKGANGTFGFIGYSEIPEFVDRNYAPSYDVVPIKEFPGFGTDQYPTVLEFYKQRLGHFATLAQPQKMWFSRPLFFTAMTTSVPLQKDDAIIATLVGRERHTINWALELQKFILFTDSAEWVVETEGDAALSASTIDPQRKTKYGCAKYLRPIDIGDRILFVQGLSNVVYDMGYEFVQDSYKADDLSRLVRHFFTSTTIESWAWAQHPYNVICTVAGNGTCPVLTYARDHEIWGWTEGFITNGLIKQVVTVAEGNQHAIYMLVERVVSGETVSFLERAEITYSKRIEDQFHVDAGLTYSDIRVPIFAITRDENIVDFSLDEHGFTVGQTLLIELGDNLRDIDPKWSSYVTVTSIDSDHVICETTGKEVPDGEITWPIAAVLVCTQSVSGYDHLEGETELVAFADGHVLHNLSCENGAIALGGWYGRVHAGYGYVAEIETLDLDTQQLAGQYIHKAVNEISLHLQRSRSVEVGASKTDRELFHIAPREDEYYSDAPRPLDGVYETSSHVAWEPTAGAIIRSEDPTPVHILNIVPDLTYEG